MAMATENGEIMAKIEKKIIVAESVKLLSYVAHGVNKRRYLKANGCNQ